MSKLYVFDKQAHELYLVEPLSYSIFRHILNK